VEKKLIFSWVVILLFSGASTRADVSLRVTGEMARELFNQIENTQKETQKLDVQFIFTRSSYGISCRLVDRLWAYPSTYECLMSVDSLGRLRSGEFDSESGDKVHSIFDVTEDLMSMRPADQHRKEVKISGPAAEAIYHNMRNVKKKAPFDVRRSRSLSCFVHPVENYVCRFKLDQNGVVSSFWID
jgi:hypothetical protein